MKNDIHDKTKETDSLGDVANLGIMRPPFIYLGAIVLGLLLHLALPLRIMPYSAGWLFGIAIVIVAITLFVSAVRAFRAANTPVPGNRPTATIVRSGPYGFSRNPIYLSFSLIQVGIGFCLNSLWLLITLIPATALMSFVVIPREERYLEDRFPSDYRPYKASVRRWL